MALAAGSWLGLEAGLPGMPWALLAAGAGGAWVGRVHLVHCLPDRVTNGGPAGGRSPDLPLLLLLLGLTALRATGPPLVPLSTLEGPLEGLWEPESSGGGLRGTLVGPGGRVEGLELPGGSVRAGERLRLLTLPVAVPPARGPYGAPGSPSLPVRADEVVRVQCAPSVLPGGLVRSLERLRVHLLERCDALPEPRAAALVRALACGDDSQMDGVTAELFTRTGVRHLLAVSGSHVGLMALMLFGPLAWGAAWLVPRRLRWGWLPRLLLALMVLAYIPLSGSAAPVRRAALALVLATLAPLLSAGRPPCRGRWPDGLSLWSLALTVECAADPRALRSVSLALSYSATLGMILASGLLQRALAPRAQRRTALGPTGCARALHALLLRGVGWLRAAVAASVVAVLATLPIAWSLWGETSLPGILATPLSLPLCALLMLGGWIHALIPATSPWLAPALVRLTDLLLGLLRWVDLLPGTPTPLPLRPWPVVAAACGLALAALSVRASGARASLARIAAVAWALLLLPWSAAPRALELHALDVGHGTAVALRGPGLGTLVLDCGSRDRKRVAQQALAPLLARWESGQIGVILTHDDRDHSGGLEWLVERRPPQLWAGALPALLGERLPHTRPRVSLGSGGATLYASGKTGIGVRLLRGREEPGNEGSYSLLVTLGDQHVLLMGDAEDPGLADVLRQGQLPPRVAMLLAPHHGSDSRWLAPLLDQCQPEQVWISAAWDPAAGRELERRGIPWRLTARDGPLALELGP